MLKLASVCGSIARARQPAATHLYRLFSESGVAIEDPVTLKKFVGVTDNLGSYPDARAEFKSLLDQVKDAVQSIPESSGYRQAVEGTVQYRLKVLEENESNEAVEEVLDAHMEELIVECRNELKLVPEIARFKPWDVPADHAVPVFDYHDASEILGKK